MSPQPAPDAEITAALRALDFPAEWEIAAYRSGRAKNLALKVDEHVHVTVTVPAGMTGERAVYHVRCKKMWLYRQARLLGPYIPDHPVKELVGGESFPLFGRNCRLRLVDDGPVLLCDETTRVSGWTKGYTQEIHLRRDQAHHHGAAHLKQWYTDEGHKRLAGDYPGSLNYWVNRLGLVEHPKLVITELKPRQWGRFSTRTETLTLHWALFQLDRSLVEYVMVRELVKAVADTPRYAAYKLRVPMCDHAERAERLRKEGCRAWLGDITNRPTNQE